MKYKIMFIMGLMICLMSMSVLSLDTSYFSFDSEEDLLGWQVNNGTNIGISILYNKLLMSGDFNNTNGDEAYITYKTNISTTENHTFTFGTFNPTWNTLTQSDDTVLYQGIILGLGADLDNATGCYLRFEKEDYGNNVTDIMFLNSTGFNMLYENATFEQGGEFYLHYGIDTITCGLTYVNESAINWASNTETLPSEIDFSLHSIVLNNTNEESNVSVDNVNLLFDGFTYENETTPYGDGGDSPLIEYSTNGFFETFEPLYSWWLNTFDGGDANYLNITNNKLIFNNSDSAEAVGEFMVWTNGTEETDAFLAINISEYNYTMSIDVEELVLSNPSEDDTLIMTIGLFDLDGEGNSSMGMFVYNSGNYGFGYTNNLDGDFIIENVTSTDGTLYVRYDGTTSYFDFGDYSYEVNITNLINGVPGVIVIHANTTGEDLAVAEGDAYIQLDNFNLTLSFLEELPQEDVPIIAEDYGPSPMESAILGIGIIAGILGALYGLMNGFTLTSLLTLLIGLIIFMVSLQFIH